MDENQEKKKKKILKRIGIWGTAFIVLVVLNVVFFSAWGVDHYSRINPEFCSTCHNMESHVESYIEGNTMDNVHYQAGVGCKDCHSDYSITDEVASVWHYVTGNYEEVLSRRKFEDDMCTSCHISMEYLAANTDYLVRNPHQSHWPDVRCGACHLSHDDQVDYCARCHDNGGQRLTGGEIIPRADNPWATDEVESAQVEN